MIRDLLSRRRLLVVLGLALVTVAAGAGGYAIAQSAGPRDAEVKAAHEAAYREAFDLAEKAGYIRNRRDGFDDGELEGLKAGRLAGRLDARAAIASAEKVKRSKPPSASAFTPPETVWAVGDTDAGAGANGVAQLLASNKMEHLLYLGDVYETGTRAEWANNYDPWMGQFANITQPTPGNHDWTNHGSGYDWYWQQAKGRRQPHNYAFSAGGWQIISMNSEQDISGQASWARDQIASTPAFGTCRLGFWHRPLISAGTEHGDDGEVRPLWDALAGNASIVVNGHEHDMQTFKPVDGITEFVSGAGGRHRYSLRSDSRLKFGNDSDYGALRLVLQPGSARYAHVNTAGNVLDSGTVRCKRGRR